VKQERTEILSHTQVNQKIRRIAHEIYEHCFDEKGIILVGITGRGYMLAKKLENILKEISPLKITLSEMQMDKNNPLNAEIVLSNKEINIDKKTVILVDDVLNTGKTLMYGTRYLLGYSLKKLITVVLVNRRHRLFPIRADFVGLTLATTMQEHIEVDIGKKKEAVYLV
jgi:pyrimidine operon attenuation protein / uracil phosphoribosyltransferase